MYQCLSCLYDPSLTFPKTRTNFTEHTSQFIYEIIGGGTIVHSNRQGFRMNNPNSKRPKSVILMTEIQITEFGEISIDGYIRVENHSARV